MFSSDGGIWTVLYSFIILKGSSATWALRAGRGMRRTPTQKGTSGKRSITPAHLDARISIKFLAPTWGDHAKKIWCSEITAVRGEDRNRRCSIVSDLFVFFDFLSHEKFPKALAIYAPWLSRRLAWYVALRHAGLSRLQFPVREMITKLTI